MATETEEGKESYGPYSLKTAVDNINELQNLVDNIHANHIVPIIGNPDERHTNLQTLSQLSKKIEDIIGNDDDTLNVDNKTLTQLKANIDAILAEANYNTFKSVEDVLGYFASTPGNGTVLARLGELEDSVSNFETNYIDPIKGIPADKTINSDLDTLYELSEKILEIIDNDKSASLKTNTSLADLDSRITTNKNNLDTITKESQYKTFKNVENVLGYSGTKPT